MTGTSRNKTGVIQHYSGTAGKTFESMGEMVLKSRYAHYHLLRFGSPVGSLSDCHCKQQPALLATKEMLYDWPDKA
jgi:hypothetical protein